MSSTPQQLIRRSRRPLAALLLIVFLATAVVVAHSAIVGHQMDDTAAMCLAVAETAAGLAVAALAAWKGHRLARPTDLVPRATAEPIAPRSPVPIAARAGPATTQVFLL